MTEQSQVPLLLVVDDNPQNLQLIGGMLGERPEFDLSFATSGSEAIEAMESVVPDLVLLDINMPVMNGFQVCNWIRTNETTAGVPVIFLTAQAETDYIVQGFRCGGSDYVVKPFQPQELLARVQVQLELHSSRIEMRRLNQELQRVNDELRMLSNTDGLLRIANRRHFDETLERDLQRAIRNREHLSMLLIDVDHFKRFNDRYGHLEGDECLKKVASLIRTTVRRGSDLVARYGGEELAVILPEADIDKASLVAEKIHGSLREENIPHESSPVAPCVTVSIGAASILPDPGSLAESLVQATDRALYAAKEGGRNRTCLAGP